MLKSLTNLSLKIALILLSIVFYIPSLQAQKTVNSKHKIVGTVIDENSGKPISFASIVIKSVTGDIIGGNVADDKGEFEITNISEGSYLLEIQFIGYQNYAGEIVINKNDNIVNAGVLKVKESISELDELVVTSERSVVEQKIDRKVINVGKDLSTLGASAADIMTNIPSVDIDQDGNLTMRGNQNVRILVDGKPTNVSASQLLQQIPSTSVKSIELITNPSAKYNPEGMSGIINIVLNKSTNKGFNGNINIGLNSGIEQRYNSSVGLNYRNGKFNVYGDYGLNVGKSPVEGEVTRSQDQSKEVWESEGDRNSQLYKAGLDFYVNDHNTLSFYTSRNVFDLDVLASTGVEFVDSPLVLGQSYTSGRNNITTTYNFDYSHDFVRKGEVLELEIDHNRVTGNELTDFSVNTELLEFDYLDNLRNNRTNLTANLDYTRPFSENGKLEMGLEARRQNVDNQYETTNTNFRDGQFNFERNIYSAYGNLSQRYKNWYFQVGARIEDYAIKGEFSQEGSSENVNTDHIFTVYPSAFITYTPNKNDSKNSYQMSYSRRVDRPGIDQINPIRVWSSFRITNVGNENLIPQYTNSLEFNYSRNEKKGSLTSGIFYRRIRDEITRFAFLDTENPGRILFSYDNYQSNSAYGFELSGSYKPMKWWSFNASFDLYSRVIRAVDAGELIEVNNNLYNFKMNHSFRPTDKLTFQIIGLYRGANENLQYLTRANYFLNLGARYSFSEGKGTLSMSFNDVFRTQQYSFDASRPIEQTGIFYRDTQTVVLGVSYLFGGVSNKSLKRKKREKNEKRGGSFL